MALRVTIEGSKSTPTDRLDAGEQITVEYTPEIQQLIRIGGAVVVEWHEDEPVEKAGEALPDGETRTGVEAPADGTLVELAQDDDEPTVPARNASRDVWTAFLDSQGLDYSNDDGRDDLIAIWDKASGS
ncbi:hypothetical protein JDBV14_00610 [Mycobacterium phage harman]|nr:hypothetical protein JDBV14_00610 [Mycobacterium phage harman]